MSWKFVFNSTVSKNKWWGHISKAHEAAKNSGYSYFTWNGWVYDGDGYRTNLKIEDLW